jgi:hypothetical protein
MTEIQDGFFVAGDGGLFLIRNGSMYELEPDARAVAFLKGKSAGYYDEDFNLVTRTLVGGRRHGKS